MKKVSQVLGMLHFPKQYLPINTEQKVHIEPYLRYSCPVWGVSGINATNKLQYLENRAARIFANSVYDACAFPINRASDDGGGALPLFAMYAINRQLIILCRCNFLASKLSAHFFGLVGGPDK